MSGSQWITRLVLVPWLLLLGTPFLESGSASADAHVEPSGIATHIAHHHEDCISCTSHRGNLPPAARAELPELRALVEPRGALHLVIQRSAASTASSPRAPPSLVLSLS
jgi:hypothetical protein